jgi:hypothetical protein
MDLPAAIKAGGFEFGRGIYVASLVGVAPDFDIETVGGRQNFLQTQRCAIPRERKRTTEDHPETN